MASKSRTESSRPTSRKAAAPTVFVLALVGVLAWGVWRAVRSPGVAGTMSGGASPAERAPVVPTPAPALGSRAVPSRQTSAPPVLPTPVPIPAPASSNVAATPVPPSPPVTTTSDLTGSTHGITSAPVVLSTQVFRASLVVPEAMPTNAVPGSAASSNAMPAWSPRGATNYLEAQIALAGMGISSGSIDGVGGAQTAAALKAFQLQQGLEQTGWLDRNTRKALMLKSPPWVPYRVGPEDLLRLAPVPDTWVARSQVAGLEHETLLERLAERFQSHPALLRKLNPTVDWTQPAEGLELTVPSLPPVPARRAGIIRISLPGRFLRVFDTGGRLIAHFPCSIARRVEKRPVGDLQVVVTVPNPDYTWDPEVFPESPESRTVGRRLRIPPGPNNPVGIAWIGLNRSGYGIHGTPKPEEVGRTESHGCFRLANWNAELLRRMAWPGLTVRVEGETPVGPVATEPRGDKDAVVPGADVPPSSISPASPVAPVTDVPPVGPAVRPP
jgi:lipoprotein-anchoring transpeptidase ErfK/SrfK